jgi:hypothetical protein
MLEVGDTVVRKGRDTDSYGYGKVVYAKGTYVLVKWEKHGQYGEHFMSLVKVEK